MSYISSHHQKYQNKIQVWERTRSGRLTKEYTPPRYFYVPDEDGEFLGIDGVKLKKLTFNNDEEFDDAVRRHSVKYESDIAPLEKLMQDVYYGKELIQPTIGFLDIEVDYHPDIGFAGPQNPYAPINAITVYLVESSTYFTLYLVPPALKGFESELEELLPSSENYFMFQSERELLDTFVDIIDDVDIISGWNSDFYDLPYLGKRLEMLYGEKLGLKKLTFKDAPPPRWGEQERFKGSDERDLVLNLTGRVHLDFMRIFKKFNLEGRQSYALAAIAADECDVPKLEHDETLHELYHGTYRPDLSAIKPESDQDDLYRLNVARELLRQQLESTTEQAEVDELTRELVSLDRMVKLESVTKFCKYNRRDSEVLAKLNNKFRYIELATEMVHEATVNYPAIFGSVQLIDSAIINFAHHQWKKIVHDKSHKPKTLVEGALVMTPKPGLHKVIASVDINSLYPNTFRTLNLSPEKIIGQLLEYEDGWRALYELRLNPDDGLKAIKTVNLLLEGSSSLDEAITITVGDLNDMLNERKWAVSAYGTILDQSSGEGLIPAVLSYWYSERKKLQAKKKDRAAEADKILANGVKITPEMLSILTS